MPPTVPNTTGTGAPLEGCNLPGMALPLACRQRPSVHLVEPHPTPTLTFCPRQALGPHGTLSKDL